MRFFKIWSLRVAKAGEFLDTLSKGQTGCETTSIDIVRLEINVNSVSQFYHYFNKTFCFKVPFTVSYFCGGLGISILRGQVS